MRSGVRADLFRIGVLLMLCVGVLLRLDIFIFRGSLNLDEAMLSLNIVTRSFFELMRPLDMRQMAPPLFLWIEKLSVLIGGVGEWSLRAFPLLSGICFLFLVWRAAGRWFSGSDGLLALAVASVSPAMIRYSNEVKQYGSDALVSLVLIWLALAYLQSQEQDQRRAWSWLIAVGVLAPWLSQPSEFMLATLVAVLFLKPDERRQPFRLLGVSALWAGSGAGSVFMIRDAATAASMREFWAGNIVQPTPSGVVRGLSNLQDAMMYAFLGDAREGFGTLLRHGLALAITLLVVTGLISLARRQLSDAFLLAGPVLAGVGAAMLRQYPIDNRLWLFSAPGFFLLFAEGAHVAGRTVSARHACLVATALCGLVLVPPGAWSYRQSYVPLMRQHARPVIAQLRTVIRPEDPVYVFTRSLPEWLFYSTRWETTDIASVREIMRMASPPDGLVWRAHRGIPSAEDLRVLTRRSEGVIELLGISSLVTGSYVSRESVDTLWAGGEMRRIHETGARCFWVFFMQDRGPDIRAMSSTMPSERALLQHRIVSPEMHVAEMDAETSKLASPEARRYCFHRRNGR